MSRLSGELGAALDRISRHRPLLIASDYDGVLSPLVDDPSAAAPLDGVAEVLARLAALPGVTVAMVSGRGVDDLRTTSGFGGPLRWVGSHGAEFDGPLPDELAARRDGLREELAETVAAVPGARLEVKPAGVAVHVREVRDRDAAAALLEHLRATADPSLTLKPGKDVLELAVLDADKGGALRRLREETGAEAALYLGDDRTDEDGFRDLDGDDDVSVKVGDGDTVARYRVADPPAALGLLRDLVIALS